MQERKNTIRLIALFCIAFFSAISAYSQEIRVILPEEVLEGEVFQIQYEIFSDYPLQETPELEEKKAFELVTKPTIRKFNPSLFNGQNYYTLILNCLFRTKKAGKVEIPKISIQVNGKKISSHKGFITVLELPKKEDVKCFVELDASKTLVKLGDTLSLTYKLYTTREIGAKKNINRIIKFNTPNLTGFNIQDMTPYQQNYTLEKIKGIDYKVYVIRKLMLQPTHIGTRELGGGYIEVEYEYSTGRITRDQWGRQFDEQYKEVKECPINSLELRVHNMVTL